MSSGSASVAVCTVFRAAFVVSFFSVVFTPCFDAFVVFRAGFFALLREEGEDPRFRLAMDRCGKGALHRSSVRGVARLAPIRQWRGA
jgi:hypothetical protein